MLSLPFDIDVAAQDFAVATYPPGATFGPRPLKNWEFVWMLEGDASYTHGDVTVAAPEGSVVLCRPGATDFFHWDPVRRTRHAFFHFELRGTLPEAWPVPESWPLVYDPQPDSDLLRPLFRHLLAWGSRGDPLQTKLAVISLLTGFVTGEIVSGDATGRKALPEPVERAWTYIRRRLDETPADPIPLGEIAEAAHVSPEHLCRLFKAATGHAPAETVRLARLDRAATLLARSNYSVAEVAALCGFESPFHFSRRFKASFGVSPRDLRASITRGEALPVSRLVRLG